jgi:phage-related protein
MKPITFLNQPLTANLRCLPDLAQNRIARVLFYFDKNGRMVLLHRFIKKTRKTPDEDLDLAQRNKNKHERSQ